MYRIKRYNELKFSGNQNEPITYDFYNGQDVFKCGFRGFDRCLPQMKGHNLDLLVQWYGGSFLSETPLHLNAEIYRYLNIKLKNTSLLTKSRVWFITEEDPHWDEEKSVGFEMRPQDTVHFEYSLLMGDNPHWKGTVRQLKFCPIADNAEFAYNHGKMGVSLSYEYIQFAPERIRDTLAFAFRYDPEGFSAVGGTLRVDYYMLYLKLEKNGYLESPDRLGTGLRYLKIRLKNKSSGEHAVVRCKTAGASAYGPAFELKLDAHCDIFKEYGIDLFGVGTVDQIRLEAQGEFEIDYILFDSVLPVSETVECNASVSCAAAGDAYECGGLSARADLLKYARIRMSNNTWSVHALLQWTTDGDPVWDEKKTQPFRLRAQHGEIREYIVGLSQNQYWKGRVTGLRITPSPDMRGEPCFIEQAELCEDADAMTQNRDIAEGALDTSVREICGWAFHGAPENFAGYIDEHSAWIHAGNLENTDAARKGAFALYNKQADRAVYMDKRVSRQCEGVVQWDFAFQTDNPQNGGVWSLLDGSGAALCLDVRGGTLYAGEIPLSGIEPYLWYDIKAVLRLDDGQADISVNGGASRLCPLLHGAFERIEVRLPPDGASRLCGLTQMYKAGYCYENFFDDETPGTLPEGLKITSRNLFLRRASSGRPVVFQKDFYKDANGLVVFETEFLIEDPNARITISLQSDSGVHPAMVAENGAFFADTGGAGLCLWEKFRENVWYHLMILINTVEGLAEFRINGHRGFKNIPVAPGALTGLRIAAEDGEFAGDIRLKGLRAAPYVQSTVPYIDKIPGRSGLVGMQAWFLHGGFWWRVANQFTVSDKTPYLGFYDDANCECVDWQVKFMAEHGVDFVAPFFYSSLDAPVSNGIQMSNQFLRYSEQVDKLKLCLCWGEIFETATREKLLDNVLPYFIENFFKHPSYLLIDNKPVILTYSWSSVARDIGEDAAGELYDMMRACCVEEGFDGLIILGECRPNGLEGDLSDLSAAKKCRLDALFAYCNVYTPEAMEAYRDNAKKQGMLAIASPGNGWDNRYWTGASGGYFIRNSTPAQFEECLRWARAEQDREPGSPLSQMVLLDNWSEFGEGHSILPSNLYGFGYLNAVRKAFTDADERHADTLPESAYNALTIDPNRFEPERIIPETWVRYPMPRKQEEER